MKINRIALINEHAVPLAPKGGVQADGQNVYVYELSCALSRLGVKVDVFMRWDNRKSSPMVRFAERAKVIRLKAGPRHFVGRENLSPLMPEFVERFLEYCRVKKVKYDLIHSHYYHSGWAGMQAKNIFHIPHVCTFHSLGMVKKQAMGGLDSSPSERIKIEEKLLEVTDEIIATSPPEKVSILELYKNKPKKMVVISAGANLLRFTPLNQKNARQRLQLSLDKKIVVFAGRMDINKGGLVLIQAVNHIKKNWPEIFRKLEVLMFSGDPRKDRRKVKEEVKLKNEMINLIKKHKLENAIKLQNCINQAGLHVYYGAADVVVMPSYYESFGLVATEAMATGTPVVASNVGGLKWTIEDGITGFHAEPGNYRQFAKNIVKILKDPELQHRLGQNAIIHVQNNYNWDISARKILSEYESLVEKE